MIRGRALRADAACHSADVLTSVEQTVQRFMLLEGFARSKKLVYRDCECCWGDVPAIREKLLVVEHAITERRNAACSKMAVFRAQHRLIETEGASCMDADC